MSVRLAQYIIKYFNMTDDLLLHFVYFQTSGQNLLIHNFSHNAFEAIIKCLTSSESNRVGIALKEKSVTTRTSPTIGCLRIHKRGTYVFLHPFEIIFCFAAQQAVFRFEGFAVKQSILFHADTLPQLHAVYATKRVNFLIATLTTYQTCHQSLKRVRRHHCRPAEE